MLPESLRSAERGYTQRAYEDLPELLKRLRPQLQARGMLTSPIARGREQDLLAKMQKGIGEYRGQLALTGAGWQEQRDRQAREFGERARGRDWQAEQIREKHTFQQMMAEAEYNRTKKLAKKGRWWDLAGDIIGGVGSFAGAGGFGSIGGGTSKP